MQLELNKHMSNIKSLLGNYIIGLTIIINYMYATFYLLNLEK